VHYSYVIFEADYKEQVFPYQSTGLEDYKIDWSAVRLIRDTPHHITFHLPDVNKRDGTGTSVAQGGMIEGDLKVGNGGGSGGDPLGWQSLPTSPKGTPSHGSDFLVFFTVAFFNSCCCEIQQFVPVA
jgi:hypothetical protein